MTLKNLFFTVLVLSISTSCSHKGALGPTSSDSDSLNKLSSEFAAEHFFHHRGNGLLALLNLTDEQETQIKEIMHSKREQFKPRRHQSTQRPSFEERKAKRKEIHESIKNEIYAVLTTEQQAELDELKSQVENGTTPEELINLHIERLGTKLSLSEDQKNQIKSLDTWEKLLQKNEPPENRREFFKKKKGIHDEHVAQILSILTLEQKGVFLEMKAERKVKLNKHGKRFRARSHNRIEKLAGQLDFNESQKEQIGEIFEKVHAEIRGNMNGRRNGRNREELRKSMHNKMKKIDQQIQKILTPEQMKKFEQLKTERKEKRKEHSPNN